MERQLIKADMPWQKKDCHKSILCGLATKYLKSGWNAVNIYEQGMILSISASITSLSWNSFPT